MKKKSIFSQISTKPSRDSVKWAGKERSLLSTILLWSIWFCRVASLLQIFKLIFRKTALAIKRATTDKKATRVNVPPVFCEIYFILWFAFLLLAYVFGFNSLTVKIFIGYYLFESAVWVLYYTVFRRFFEENYSIYHELEYLTVVILIIPTQALGFATLYSDTFRNMLSAILGSGGDATPFPVKILGALFGAIVISMIISAFPSERVKKGYNKTKAIVIGGGDAVENRLYPALCDAERSMGKIEVLDLKSENRALPYVSYFENESELLSAFSYSVNDDSIVWVETPTDTHIKYLSSLLKSRALLIVLEKPICKDMEGLCFIEREIANFEKRERIFFLSYYVLEKALPLSMLFCYNEHYRKYLDIEDDYLVRNWRIFLGALTSAEVAIFEGEDNRAWVNEDKYGQLYETFIHNVLVASLVCGRCQSWENPKISFYCGENGERAISLSASYMGAEILLSQKKGVSEDLRKRYAKFVFSDGAVEVDFDKQSAVICFNKINRCVSISVKDVYKQKYCIMADLVARVYDGEFSSSAVDGLENQIQTIKWLIRLADENEKSV